MIHPVSGQSWGLQQLARLQEPHAPDSTQAPADTVELAGQAPAAPAPPSPAAAAAAAVASNPTAPVKLSQQETQALRTAFDDLFNSGGQGKTRLLEDNTKAWNARWRMVESAQREINVQYFCWDHDVFGMAFLGHIFKKVKDGQVHARVMVDATGDTYGTRGFKSHIGGKDYLQEVVATGHAEAKVYHPHWKKVIDQVLHPLSSYIAASNHDKILEVDGQRGMTGGRNIGYEYFVQPQDFKGAWRDTDVQFESPAAAHALRSAFEVEFGAPWINQEVHKDFLGNWVKRDLELVGSYCLMDTWLKEAPFTSDQKTKIRTSEEAREEQAQALLSQAVGRLAAEGIDREPNSRELKKLQGLARELVKYPELRGSYSLPEAPQHDGEIKILDRTSAVGTEQDQINTSLAKLARAAQKRIVIENPYVVLTDDMRNVLKEAGERGVEIWLGTNSPSSTDSDVTQAFFLEDWPRVLATTPNLHFFVATGERKLHAKVGVIDDVVSLVSSFNLDYLSSKVNSEVAAVVWSEDFAKESYQAILRDHADPVNGSVQYTILRDAQGTPIRSDGKPVLDAEGNIVNEPEITFGPENHLSAEVLEPYKKKRARWKWLREHLPQLSSLRQHFKGSPKPAPVAPSGTPSPTAPVLAPPAAGTTPS